MAYAALSSRRWFEHLTTADSKQMTPFSFSDYPSDIARAASEHIGQFCVSNGMGSIKPSYFKNLFICKFRPRTLLSNRLALSAFCLHVVRIILARSGKQVLPAGTSRNIAMMQNIETLWNQD